MRGDLDNVATNTTPFFGLHAPVSCPDVPAELLFPRNAWADKEHFDQKAAELAEKFVKNFEQFAEFASEEIKAASPKVGSPAQA